MNININFPNYNLKFKVDFFNCLNLVIFILSLLNLPLLSLWLVFMPVLNIFHKKIDGALISLFLIAIRTIINPGIGIEISNLGILKWIVIFVISFYLLFSSFKGFRDYYFILLIIILQFYLIVSTGIVSSFPLTAIFKIVSYIIPFFAIIIGIHSSNTNILNFVVNILGLVLLGGVPLIKTSVGYLRNGVSFQGLTNHPNMFGILLVLFLAAYLTLNIYRLKVFSVFIISLTLILTVLSGSRTSLFSIFIVLVLYILTINIPTRQKILFLILLSFTGLIILIIMNNQIVSFLNLFLHKGNANILYSRNNQISLNISRFKYSPYFGTGFNVPFISNFKSWKLEFNALTENGNLFLAILADTGIIGLLLFLITYGYIWTKGNNILLFIAPILISMGEMVFFSTNNIAIILYIFFGLYLKKG